MLGWFNPGRWLMLLGLCLALSVGYFSWRSHEREIGARPYKAQLAEQKRIGDAAQQVANARILSEQQAKRKADDENKLTLTALRADNKRLRSDRARSNFVPPAGAEARRPNLACFDRAELESAIQLLDGRVSPIVDQGSEAVVNLNTAKTWAQKK